MLNRILIKKCKNAIRFINILGIETSCDDTGVAIVNSNRKILSEILSSQWNIHKDYGGIVPLLAAREHSNNLPIVINEVFYNFIFYWL